MSSLERHSEEQPLEGTIYHYTSIDSLIKILETKKLAFTHSEHLNDTLEIKHGFNIIKKVIESHKIKNSQRFLQILETLFYDERLNYYVCSFSKRYDNLSLWRLYGSGGFGVALGINKEFPLLTESTTESPVIGEVFYGDKVLTSGFGKLCNRLSKILNSNLFTNQSTEDELVIEMKLFRCLGLYGSIMPIFSKHLSYEHENETRLVLRDGKYAFTNEFKEGFYFSDSRFINSSTSSEIHFLNEKLKKESRKEYLSGKRTLLSGELKPSFLQNIWLGPRVPEETISNFYRLLEIHGFDKDKIKVKKITLPYR